MNHTIICSTTCTAVVVNEKVFVLKRSSSRYGLRIAGRRLQFCCQDGCCDRGLQADVLGVVQTTKQIGATKVIIRTGQRQYRLNSIAGLPVEDVSGHVGPVNGMIAVDSAW